MHPRNQQRTEGRRRKACRVLLPDTWSLSLLLKRLRILTAQLTTPDSAKHHGKSFIYVNSLSSHNPQGGGTITAPTVQMRRLRSVSLGSQDLKSFNLYCPILPTTTPTSYTYTPPSRGRAACLPPAVGGVGWFPSLCF